MAPAGTKWDDEDSSTPPSSPPAAPIVRRSKFEDEEDDSDVADAWDEEEDSEVEREKAKAAAEAKAKADAIAAANKKSKTQRIAEKQAQKAAQKAAEEEESSSEDEDVAAKREKLRRMQEASDLKHAEDLFGDVGISNKKAVNHAVITTDSGEIVDLSKLPLFNPTTKDQFAKLRETLVPILTSSNKKAQYTLFLTEFTRQLVKDLPSADIKKLATALSTASNEKLKEEKAADKAGGRGKAKAKNKTTLAVGRDTAVRADTTNYADEGFDDDDFM